MKGRRIAFNGDAASIKANRVEAGTNVVRGNDGLVRCSPAVLC